MTDEFAGPDGFTGQVLDNAGTGVSDPARSGMHGSPTNDVAPVDRSSLADIADGLGHLHRTRFDARSGVAPFDGETGPWSQSHPSSLRIDLGCFLSGTRIETPSGEKPVETLAAGDLVAVHRDGETLFEPVAWLGRRRIDVRTVGGALDAFPVRVRAHAFARNVPRRDLLLTSQHCVVAYGRLVPVRRLVNGGSIVVDRTIIEYDYFQVELARHSILVSEGLETESYLDTGDGGHSANAGVSAMRSRVEVEQTDTDPAAPLTVHRDSVEPIWMRLHDRAESLGLVSAKRDQLVQDPDLRLVSATGVEIRPLLCDGAVYAFVIPGGLDALRLVSRSSRQFDEGGPCPDDRRELGVLVGKIGVGIGRRRTVLTKHLDHGPLAGWHATEPAAAARWTDGNAALPLESSRLWAAKPGGEMVYLDIEIVHAGPYC